MVTASLRHGYIMVQYGGRMTTACQTAAVGSAITCVAVLLLSGFDVPRETLLLCVKAFGKLSHPLIQSLARFLSLRFGLSDAPVAPIRAVGGRDREGEGRRTGVREQHNEESERYVVVEARRYISMCKLPLIGASEAYVKQYNQGRKARIEAFVWRSQNTATEQTFHVVRGPLFGEDNKLPETIHSPTLDTFRQ